MGLGDPLIANRVLLWGVGDAARSPRSPRSTWRRSSQGIHALPPSLVGVVSTLVLVTACAEWLAFFPPRGYVRRFAPSRCPELSGATPVRLNAAQELAHGLR